MTRTLLSPRHLQILQLIADGKTRREIAQELYISPHSVKNTLQNAFSRLKDAGLLKWDENNHSGLTAPAVMIGARQGWLT